MEAMVDTFHVFDPHVPSDQHTPLQIIADARVAAGQVDHAIASGLFLFQYASFWYWLVNRTEAILGEPGQDLVYPWLGLNYEPENVRVVVAPACRSCAFHNIRLDGPETATMNRLTLADDPVAYLSVICDELQQWHRPAAGTENIAREAGYADRAWRADEIMLAATEMRLSGAWEVGATVTLSATNELMRIERAKQLREKYDEKLEGWRDILEILP